MKLRLIVATLALVAPASALANGEIIVPTPAGVLDYQVQGVQQFTFDATVPVDQITISGTGNDLRNIAAPPANYQDWYLNLRECTRIYFQLPNSPPTGSTVGDTGWHCADQSLGHPSTYIETDLNLHADNVVNYYDIGHECPLPYDLDSSQGYCSSPGDPPNGPHPYRFPQVNLVPLLGSVIPGQLYSNICVDFAPTPDFRGGALGCIGSTTDLNLMSLNDVKPKDPPVKFTLRTRKARTHSLLLEQALRFRRLTR
jgi:hypothetical protein